MTKSRNNLQAVKPRAYITALLFLLFSLIFFNACINQEVCEDVAVVPVRIGFYRIDTTLTAPSVKTTVNALTITGIGSDSIFYNQQDNVGQIELPLNSSGDTTVFVLQWQPTGLEVVLTDTLRFYYKRKPSLVSMECGFTTFYELEEVYHEGVLIDALNIENSNIRTTLDEHIKIYPVIHTADNRR